MYTLETRMKKYRCIKQDTFNKLELEKIYNINNYVIYNDFSNIPLFRLSRWQLENMFEEVWMY